MVSFRNSLLFAILMVLGGCAESSVHLQGAASSTTGVTCKHGVSLTPSGTAKIRYFYQFRGPNARGLECPLSDKVTLCSSEPLVATDNGFEVSFKQDQNPELMEKAALSDEPGCTLLADLGGVHTLFVSGKGTAHFGKVIERPVARDGGPVLGNDSQPIPKTSVAFVDGRRVLYEALKWNEKYFRYGYTEQCANFVREVLKKSCNSRFSWSLSDPLQSRRPLDYHLLGAAAPYGPGYADSLAGSELGAVIKNPRDLRPGDLVFLANTYGAWPKGVITHVAIYAGNGEMIDRSTFVGPVRLRNVNWRHFTAGLRLFKKTCPLSE